MILSTGPVECLPIKIFGRHRGPGSALQQQQLALDARQLGNAPALRVTFGMRERLVDCYKALGQLACATQAFCQFAEKCRITAFRMAQS